MTTAMDQDLNDITTKLLRMLSIVREMTQKAKDALIHQNRQAAEQCIAQDVEVDALEVNLEQDLMVLIARRQPAATDLRFISSAHRMLIDIERAGDYAAHIARAALILSSDPPLKRYTDTKRIFEVLDEMLDGTIIAIAEKDASKAEATRSLDDEIDSLHEQIQRELITLMMENPATISRALKLTSVLRHLERLGDHLENINEYIHFWVTAERMA